MKTASSDNSRVDRPDWSAAPLLIGRYAGQSLVIAAAQALQQGDRERASRLLYRARREHGVALTLGFCGRAA